MRLAALDIGGANIKGLGPGETPIFHGFELWREPEGLSATLEGLLLPLWPLDALLVTMTGELCDCFETKVEGVRRILASVRAVTAKRDLPVLVWRDDQRFLPLPEAMKDPLPSAAANWLALASFAGSFAPRGSALLIDTGSTTTDIVPLSNGHPIPRGLNDTQRLLSGELVYTGASRTPLSAVVRELPYRGKLCPVSSETFATTRDAYLILGRIRESPEDCRTADGRPATKARARDRMARMLCADRETFDDDDAREAAIHVEKEQTLALRRSVERVVADMGSPPQAVIVSGSGDFLAHRAAEALPARMVSLAKELGAAISEVAPAYALTWLFKRPSNSALPR